ncbi:MAG: formate dehydrogenase accessory protein FdhE [Gemmatimonadota bacterium]|nr:formate dehydrogenase accessory protein FdhE [Gemmatimonadota bacterium]
MTPPSSLLRTRAVLEQPALADAVSLLRALIAAMRELDMPLRSGVPHPPAVDSRLANGLPALTGEPLIDGSALLAAVVRLATMLPNPSAGIVAEALATHRSAIDLDELAGAALAGDWEAIAALASRLDLDEHMLRATLDYATRPALRRGAMAVAEELARYPRETGRCPACGSPPLLAELRGPDAERVLRCGRCSFAWPFPRVACTGCGERDHRQLGYLHAGDEEEFRRAECCESCKCYLKSIAVLTPLSSDLLLETDLATTALDIVAGDRGYRHV